VAAGACAYLLLVGAARHFVDRFRVLASVLRADVVVQRARGVSPSNANLTPQEIRTLAALPEVAGVSKVALGTAAVVGDYYFLVFGVDGEDAAARSLAFLSGRFPQRNADEVVVGALAAERLGLSLGSILSIRGRSLLVTGIFRTFHAVLDNGAVLTLDLAQSLFNLKEGVTFAFLSLKDPKKRDLVAAQINQKRIGLEASTADSWFSMYGQIDVVQKFARVIGFFTLLVTVMGVSSLLSTSLAERAKELALLRSLGWTRARVGFLVTIECLCLLLGGVLLALPLGEGVLAATARLEVKATGLLPQHIASGVFFEMLGVTLAAGLVGLIPLLLRVLRVPPAPTLRMP
jgi:ABC-type lipoprotein release transport system permease subunit